MNCPLCNLEKIHPFFRGSKVCCRCDDPKPDPNAPISGGSFSPSLTQDDVRRIVREELYLRLK